ncbi:MAG TPA: YrhK family protein [Nocardioides sp.]|nr:YrhK family protein [Nocardioides sp.]
MSASRDLTLHVGHDELVIRQRYETLSIANDVLIALWFVGGSILFFWESTTQAATWLFLAGSVEFLARPLIRLARRMHLQRIGSGHRVHESSFDF